MNKKKIFGRETLSCRHLTLSDPLAISAASLANPHFARKLQWTVAAAPIGITSPDCKYFNCCMTLGRLWEERCIVLILRNIFAHILRLCVFVVDT